MSKDQSESRGFALLVMVAFLLILGAFVVFANTSTTGYASADLSKNYQSTKTETSSYDACRGICYEGEKNCQFDKEVSKECLCDPSGTGNENLGCNVQYYSKQNIGKAIPYAGK